MQTHIYSALIDFPIAFSNLSRHMMTVIVQQLPNLIPKEFVLCQNHLMTLWFRDQHHLLQRAVWDRLAVLPPWDPQAVVVTSEGVVL